MKYLFFCCCFFCAALAFAQDDNHYDLYSSALIRVSKSAPEDVTGSPYYPEKQFVKGTIYDGDKIIKNIDLRLNALEDIVEVKLKEDEIYATRKSADMYFDLNGESVRLFDYNTSEGPKKGYMVCMSCDSKTSLLRKPIKKFFERIPAKTSYQKDQPAEYKDEEKLYIKFGNRDYAIELENSSKKILSQFPDHQKELETYLKEHKLNLKKANDLIQLVKYYDLLN